MGPLINLASIWHVSCYFSKITFELIKLPYLLFLCINFGAIHSQQFGFLVTLKYDYSPLTFQCLSPTFVEILSILIIKGIFVIASDSNLIHKLYRLIVITSCLDHHRRSCEISVVVHFRNQIFLEAVFYEFF